ncbi:hypothetical protein [Rothia sp. ZJ1223]|uniref:hypothetical protein n=1 Tax=Rothia sp. ZJ1223 TaxID=2811098 RepID=UPI0019582A20|nr:hypothetical protein [Rothia sp. ZJ1223]
MVYRFRERWLLWIVLNIAQIILWLTSDTDGAMNICGHILRLYFELPLRLVQLDQTLQGIRSP